MKGIEKFYKRDAIDKFMFAHVTALINNLPITVVGAIKDFQKTYRLSVIDFPWETFVTTYGRMKKEFTEANKDES